MADAALASIIERFDEFFDSYYSEAISDIIIGFPETSSLKVDIKDLEKFDPELASEAIERPDLIIEAADESLRKKLSDIDLGEHEVHVRFFGQTVNTPLVQDVGSRFIGKMIMLDSLVIKRSEINPRVKRALYKCTFCGATLMVKGQG